MFKFISNFVLTICFFEIVRCQTLPQLPQLPQLPSANVFLSRLFDVASSEIQNLANNFDFHDVSIKDVVFILHTKSNKSIVINPKNTSTIDPSKPTKFIIHGWQASGTDDLNKKMADMYHQNGDYNVIAMDWSEHSKKVYMHSASNTKNIGNVLGDFVLEVTKKDPKLLKNMHLIGHSLGAHVAGFGGKRIYEKSGKKVGRITGLDVAAPMFETPTKRSADSRLSEDDAEFVDVIHTNAGFLGVSGETGTADFYVENGGPLQPGCFDPINIFESFACSHLKAFEYFMDSITGKKYEALSCPNSINYHILACNSNHKVVMGEHVPKTAKGTYYLETDSPLPYSKILDNPLGVKINTPRLRLPFINI